MIPWVSKWDGAKPVKRSKVAAVAGACIAVALGVVVYFYSMSDIAHESIRLHLRLIGESIYEYHSKTGQWPTRMEDLAQTPLALRSPYWRQMLEQGTNVIVWRTDLKPDPKDNAGLVLAYHNSGLLARLGRQWACWGDLRTEYVREKDLRAHLEKLRPQRE